MATTALSTVFLEETLRLAFLKKSFLEKITPHLKFQYLPSPELKQIYKDITNHYSLTGTLPTIGTIYEKNKDNDKLLNVLNRIKESEIVDPQTLLVQLEKYIKDVRFAELWDKVMQKHQSGEKEQAVKMMAEGSQEIVEFSILKDNGNFLKVFEDFQKVQLEKQIKKEENIVNYDKIPFGILPLDIVTEGGMDRKDTVLFILRSGIGKSTVLKWIGMYACRLGYDVLHIQLEGSSEECMDKYTQVWSAISYSAAKTGNIESEKYHKLLSIAQDMVVLKHDISIKSFESFDESTMVDVRDAVVEYIKERGKAPDLLLFDSMDLADPGDGVKYSADTQSVKMKINNSSRKFKNICNEFDMRGITALQASEVKAEVWNDPGRTITRSDAAGDKSVANSYSMVFTGNQTLDEEKRRTMRIYIDKMRYYSMRNRTYPICTNFAIGRFFDLQRTKRVFKDIYFQSEEDKQ